MLSLITTLAKWRTETVPYLFFLALALMPVGASGNDAEPFYKTIETPPAPELTPTQAMETFVIAPGFEVTLVAAEPLVEDPVAITWDEFGLMYVVEMRGYMPDAFGNGKDEPVGMVVQLEDTDGDGIYDVRTVLQDGLVLPRALAVVNDGLLIGAPPNLWLCPRDDRGNGRISCEGKKRVERFGSTQANVEHDENGMLLAIDNWFYNAKSNRRMRYSDGQVVSEPTLARGQWGITSNNEGALYYNTNSNLLLGDLYNPQPIIEAGNRIAAGLSIPVSKNDRLYAVRVNTGVNRAYVPGVLREDGRLDKPTSASGMAFYRGDQFPESYSGDVFVTEPAANAIVHLKLNETPLSATTEHILYPDETWGQREFMASTDERFRPVDAKVGPDGALYVIDMYRGIIQDTMFMSDELREQILARNLDKPVGMGRIWKITHTDGSDNRTSAMDTSHDGLIAGLSDANGWRRDTAQRLLLGVKDQELASKLETLVTSGDGVGALHALWTLEGRDDLTGNTVRTALRSDRSAMKLAAMRAGRDLLEAEDLLPLLASESPAVKQQAIMYLGRFADSPEVLGQLISYTALNASNPISLAAVYAAVAGIEAHFATRFLAISDWTESDERSSNFIEGLFSQALAGNPSQSSDYLDLIEATEKTWLKVAILRGLQEGARGEDFERVVLAQPHPLFDDVPEALWGEIARTRQLFTWAGDDLPANAKPLTPSDLARYERGKDYFTKRCAICHGSDGKGIGAIGPPLAGSDWVTGPTERLARIVLHGVKGEIEVLGKQWDSAMPGHGNIDEFNNETAAGLLTYLHRAWGHSGRIIQPDFVAELRAIELSRSTQWTVEELMAIDTNTHYRDYEGVYGGGNFELRISYDGSGLNIASVYFNGDLEEVSEGEFLFAPRDFQFEFLMSANRVTGIKMPSQGGAVLPRVSGL